MSRAYPASPDEEVHPLAITRPEPLHLILAPLEFEESSAHGTSPRPSPAAMPERATRTIR